MPHLTWCAIQATYTPDSAEHLACAAGLGLECAPDLFEQLFPDHHGDEDFGEILRFVVWSAFAWEEGELSGVALRQVAVPRASRSAVDEARRRTAEEDFSDDPPDVMQHWEAEQTWIRSPIVPAGGVLGTHAAPEIFGGSTRLGNLLAALDRRELPESARHRMWRGRAS